ncbi:hypothetical protein LXL04_003913 [Taraxacum kok-saghyz]
MSSTDSDEENNDVDEGEINLENFLRMDTTVAQDASIHRMFSIRGLSVRALKRQSVESFHRDSADQSAPQS